MGDFYTAHPEALHGQPKRTIGNYVEQNGLLVPRRFDSLHGAIRSGNETSIRGEHVQDYDGASDLVASMNLPSYSVLKQIKNELQGKDFGSPGLVIDSSVPQICMQSRLTDNDMNIVSFTMESFTQSNLEGRLKNISRGIEAAGLKGEDPGEFLAGVSFSYWERIRGINGKIIADDSIAHRYHILHGSNYIISEDGDVAYSSKQVSATKVESIVNVYEKVRSLDNFDPNHCPIIEFQDDGNQIYFLQYHRIRDFRPAEFSLDRPVRHDEIEALFVRGATPPDGSVIKTTRNYGAMQKAGVAFDVKHEDGSFDIHHYNLFTELRIRGRKLQIVRASGKGGLGGAIRTGHIHISRMFKPGISVVLAHDDLERLVSSDESMRMSFESMEDGEDKTVDLYVISDGKRAFVKRVN